MKEYTVDIGGVPHTMQLDADDVKRYPGAKAVTASKSESKVVKAAEDK